MTEQQTIFLNLETIAYFQKNINLSQDLILTHAEGYDEFLFLAADDEIQFNAKRNNKEFLIIFAHELGHRIDFQENYSILQWVYMNMIEGAEDKYAFPEEVYYLETKAWFNAEKIIKKTYKNFSNWELFYRLKNKYLLKYRVGLELEFFKKNKLKVKLLKIINNLIKRK